MHRADRSIYHLAACCALVGVGLVASALMPELAPGLAGLTLALVGATTERAMFWSVPPQLMSGVAAAGGIAFINVFGALGGFVGPFMMGWLKDATGGYPAGLVSLAGLAFLSAILTLLAARLIRTSPDPGSR